MARITVRRVLTWVFGALLVILAVVVATPLGRYILRAGWEEAKILMRRVPIEKVLADSSTSPALRARLQLVVDALPLATRRLSPS